MRRWTLLLPLLIAGPLLGQITIDGHFGDWAGVPLLDQPPQPVEDTMESGTARHDEADIWDLWYASNSSYFFFSYSLQGNYTPGSYYYHLYLDTDGNPSTGFTYYSNLSIGADYMVENGGLHHYTGTGGEWSWEPISGLTFADSGNRVELSIPFDALGVSPSQAIHVIVQVNDLGGYPDYDFAPDNHTTEYYICAGPTAIREEDMREAKARPSLWIQGKVVWVVPSAYGHYRVVLYDPSGRRHRVLFRGVLEGPQRISWDTPLLPSGTYFLVLLRGDRPLASAPFTVLGQ